MIQRDLSWFLKPSKKFAENKSQTKWFLLVSLRDGMLLGMSSHDPTQNILRKRQVVFSKACVNIFPNIFRLCFVERLVR